MKSSYVIYILLGVFAILGWNIFLIQRDDKLFKAYYHETAKEQYCASLKVWHPDCKIE